MVGRPTCGATQSRQCYRNVVDPQSPSPDSSDMAPARMIFAVLIAISVAMVPVTGGAAISTKPAEMSTAANADMPCCAPDDCKGSIACALKCFNFVATLFPAAVVLPPVVDESPQFFADGTLRGFVSPPTHPPPI